MTTNDPDVNKPTPMSLLEALSGFSEVFRESMSKIEEEEEEYWESLTEEEKISVFCAVSRRIFEGEIEKRGTYRYVLYDVFGFGPEAYARAQNAGYLSIHNSIVECGYSRKLLESFCEKNDVDNAEEKINNFLDKEVYNV